MNKLEDLGIEELGVPRAGLVLAFRGNAPVEGGAFEGDHYQVELTIPPLNFANLKRLQAEEAAAKETNRAPNTMLEYVVTMVGRALRQNYKGVPTWLIEQTIDIENALEISQKVAGLSGILPKKDPVA